MTRRDYRIIAAALTTSRPPVDDRDCLSQWSRDVKLVADALSADNYKFDRSEFIGACEDGLPEDERS